MKTATVRQLRSELETCNRDELIDLCLRLSKFKKENKELLTYLLFEASDEDNFIAIVKSEMQEQFQQINTTTYYYIKKSVRKILRSAKKYIRYSGKKETEVELLLYFCEELKNLEPSIKHNTTLLNLYDRQIAIITKSIAALHEDLQYDYNQLLITL